MAAMKILIGSVTQGGADAFAEAEIPTGLTPATNVAFRIRFLEFFVPVLPGVDSQAQVALSRKSFSSFPGFSERSIIARVDRNLELVTSGIAVQDPVVRIKFDADDDVLLVEDPIYFQIDSNNTGAANTSVVRVGYQVIRISEIDRLTLVANSLAS